MSDMHMVDNEDNRADRKEQAGSDAPEMRRIPNRKQRRLIAKRRGVFKHPGAWPYINNRASNEPKGDLHGEDSNQN